MSETGASFRPKALETIDESDVHQQYDRLVEVADRWLEGLALTFTGLTVHLSAGKLYVDGYLVTFGSQVNEPLGGGDGTYYVFGQDDADIEVNMTGVPPTSTSLKIWEADVAGGVITATRDFRDRTLYFDPPIVAQGGLDADGNEVTSVGTPTAVDSAANKQYVDDAAEAASTKATRVASTANVTVAAPGTAVFDGVTLANGEDILLKDQSTASQNGVYVFNGSGVPLTRRTDMNASAEFKPAMKVAVSEGTVNAGTTWRLATPAPITLGATSLSFVLDSVQGQRGTAAGLATLTAGVHTETERPTASTTVKGDALIGTATPAELADSAGAVGASTTRWAREDHAHAHGNRGGGALHPAATGATAGFMSAADKTAFDAATAAATVDTLVKRNGAGQASFVDPTNPDHAATKAYVDAIAQGLDVKKSVRVATTAAGTLASSFENGDTVDGVVLATNDRILIKNQAAGAENGIYTVNASGSPTRATDMDASSEATAGMFTFVEEGTVNADSGWVLTTDGTIVLGTTAIAFVQFSGAGQITPGAGLAKSGNTLFMADMVQATIKGRAAGAGTGAPTDLTGAQALAVIEATTPLGRQVDVQTFTADGTWTKPTGAKEVEVVLISAGGGGGGGERGASSYSGGGGGGGGSKRSRRFNASQLAATEAIVVGTGGTGGAGGAAPGDGNPGGLSSFGTGGQFPYTASYGGGGGATGLNGGYGAGGGGWAVAGATQSGGATPYGGRGGDSLRDGGGVWSGGTTTGFTTTQRFSHPSQYKVSDTVYGQFDHTLYTQEVVSIKDFKAILSAAAGASATYGICLYYNSRLVATVSIGPSTQSATVGVNRQFPPGSFNITQQQVGGTASSRTAAWTVHHDGMSYEGRGGDGGAQLSGDSAGFSAEFGGGGGSAGDTTVGAAGASSLHGAGGGASGGGAQLAGGAGGTTNTRTGGGGAAGGASGNPGSAGTAGTARSGTGYAGDGGGGGGSGAAGGATQADGGIGGAGGAPGGGGGGGGGGKGAAALAGAGGAGARGEVIVVTYF